MKILAKDYRRGFAKLKIESLDDLWYLTYVIEKTDVIEAKTFRKIKLSGDEERSKNVIKKPAFLKIEAEKIEFSRFSNVLRVSGIIREGPEDIPLGSHHTINLEEGSEFALNKKHFLGYQIDKIEEASKESKNRILIVVHDREEAYFALLKKYGYELLSKIKGDVQKKSDMKTDVSDFFAAIRETILEYDEKYSFSNIIIASPGFWKEYIQRQMKDKKNIVYATCSSVGENGINEVIRRPEVQTVLKEEKFAEEMKKVEEFLEEISKKGKAEYGIAHINSSIETGAVSELLITDGMIHRRRQENSFEEVEEMMRKVESMQGKVFLICSEHVGGKKLDGLGGMGAILRYKLSY